MIVLKALTDEAAAAREIEAAVIPLAARRSLQREGTFERAGVAVRRADTPANAGRRGPLGAFCVRVGSATAELAARRHAGIVERTVRIDDARG